MRRVLENPIITPKDVSPSREGFKVSGVFNPAATRVNGETILLVRVAEVPVVDEGWIAAPFFNPKTEKLDLFRFKKNDPLLDITDPRLIRHKDSCFLSSISHLRRAKLNAEGDAWEVEETPCLFPKTEYETFGIEDARITTIEGQFFINYTAVSEHGSGTALATSPDFETFTRQGIIFAPDNRDVVLFPEKIGDRYFALHRPHPGILSKPSMWIASSENLFDWGHHQLLMKPRLGYWDEQKISSGTVPIRTDEGWLVIYHGVDRHGCFSLGSALLDLEDPRKVISRSTKPILAPTEPYEVRSRFGKMVFSNGAVVHGEGEIDIFYGATNQSVAMVHTSIAEILGSLASCALKG